jgi:hypothetical protein
MNELLTVIRLFVDNSLRSLTTDTTQRMENE